LNGKNYLVAIMLTALMLALMFIPMSGSQTAVQYDPWADMNDDGKIDIKDIAYSSRLFGTLGDPTKSVVISGYNQKLLTYKVEISAKTQGNVTIDTYGFKKASVVLNTNSSLQNPLMARVGFVTENGYIYIDSEVLPPVITTHYPTWNKIWINPSIVTITKPNLGYRFNVTVWVVTNKNSYAWQVCLYFDKSFLKALRAGYTAGATSEWATHRTGGSTSPINPIINNIDGYVCHGESLQGINSVPPVIASLCWIEFEVVRLCVNNDKTVLSISFEDPFATYVLDTDLNEIPIPKYDATVRWWFNTVLTYEVIAPKLIIEYYNPNDVDVELSIEIYLTT